MSTSNEPTLALGLMSGTSIDGVDAALLWTDGESIAEPRGALTVSYDDGVRSALREAIDQAEIMPNVTSVERAMTLAHASAVSALLRQQDIEPEDVSVIGFHGQTLLHRPEEGVTWQIGDGSMLAVTTEIDVVSDFRTGERYDEGGHIAASGQADTKSLEGLLDHPYFDRSPPKSLDRNNFSSEPIARMTVADGAATLALFTVHAIVRAAHHFHNQLPDGSSPVEDVITPS